MIPVELNNRNDDYVSYVYQIKDNPEIDRKNDICYHASMRDLQNARFWLRPLPDAKSLLNYEIFSKWFSLCKENHLVVDSIQTSHENGRNLLHIPHNKFSRHLVYATLCCYRWTENQPGIAYSVVKALEENPNLDFFQCLHYGIMQRCYFLVHTFSPILMDKGPMYHGSGSSINKFIPYSLAISWFFRPDKTGERICEKTMSTDTTGSITALIGKHGIALNSEKFMLKTNEQVLDPRLSVLYTEEPNAAKIEQIVKEIKNG